MPLYEYRCEACGRTFEFLQKLNDAPLETCSQCGGALHKLVSAPAFQFKGSGWYVTDYARKGGSSPASEGKSTSPAGSDGPGDSAPEKKPAAEPATTSSPAKGPDND